MTDRTRRLFERIGDAPKQKRGHIPTIRIAGSTVKIDCLCGKRLQHARGCNRSGMDYAISYGKSAYESHLIDATRS